MWLDLMVIAVKHHDASSLDVQTSDTRYRLPWHFNAEYSWMYPSSYQSGTDVAETYDPWNSSLAVCPVHF